MFHAETSAPSALGLPSVISLSTIETPLTPDGDCVAGYRGTDAEKALDPRKGISEPSAATSRASQKKCACPFAFRSRVRLGAVPRHGTPEDLASAPGFAKEMRSSVIAHVAGSSWCARLSLLNWPHHHLRGAIAGDQVGSKPHVLQFSISWLCFARATSIYKYIKM